MITDYRDISQDTVKDIFRLYEGSAVYPKELSKKFNITEQAIEDLLDDVFWPLQGVVLEECRYYKEYKAVFPPKCECRACHKKYKETHENND